MDKARLEDLMEKGYVTRVLSTEDQGALAAKSEQELVELGYLTHVGFDGLDSTVEEEAPVEVVDAPQPANLEPEDQPENQPENQPVVPVVEEEEEAGDEPEVEPAVEE